MTRKITCIECPQGCVLSVDIESCKVIRVDGSKCPKGEKYALSEVENPVRVLTSTILTIGLPLKMVPVRTDHPIPKSDLKNAMEEIKKIRLNRPVQAGTVIVKNILGLEANLITTRDCNGQV